MSVITKLYNNNVFSDFKFVCGHKIVYAHKCILSIKIKYFDAFIKNLGKNKSSIDIPESDWESVIYILEYIYEIHKVDKTNKELDYLRICVLADKWCMEDLYNEMIELIKNICDFSEESRISIVESGIKSLIDFVEPPNIDDEMLRVLQTLVDFLCEDLRDSHMLRRSYFSEWFEENMNKPSIVEMLDFLSQRSVRLWHIIKRIRIQKGFSIGLGSKSFEPLVKMHKFLVVCKNFVPPNPFLKKETRVDVISVNTLTDLIVDYTDLPKNSIHLRERIKIKVSLKNESLCFILSKP